MTRGFLPVLFVFCAGVLWTQEATTVYVEGDASRKDTGGVLHRLDFGDALGVGEAVITKRNSRAELELPNRSSITVRSDTVFAISEAELAGGGKQSVLTTAVGSVAYKLNKFTGTSPLIRSNTMAAGVRGTSLEVFAGMDGSSLVVVTEGLVELTARGKTVSLGANEAVEVPAGQEPGEKFSRLGRALDFSTWNAGKMDDFLKDPQSGIQRVEKQLAYFQQEMEKLLPEYQKANEEAEAVEAEFFKLRESGDSEAFNNVRTYLNTDLNPRRRIMFLNIRYYALSYLSMRRFIVGGLYTEMKSRYFLNQDDAVYQDFFRIYKKIIENYEEHIIPQLTDMDI